MTFDEKVKVYEAKTRRLEARSRAVRNILIGIGILTAACAKLVAVLIH